MTNEAEEPRGFRLGFASGVFFFAWIIAVVAYFSAVWVAFHMEGPEPPQTIGAPVRAPDGLFLLTTQYETRVSGGGSRWSAYRGFEKVMHVDAWRLDTGTAQPVWRRRLMTEHEGNILDVALLGADADRLWLFMRQPIVISKEQGDVVADAQAIEARNAPLKGVLPKQLSHYRFFDGYGLVFTAADARAWLVDIQTLVAVPWEGSGPIQRETAIGPPYWVASHTKSFQKRGLTLTRDWLGVLTDDEAAALKAEVSSQARGASAAFAEYMRAPPDLSHAGPKRFRLWHSKVEEVSAAPPGWPKSLPDKWGKRPRYSDFMVFEKSPEFLQAGLLSDGRSNLPLLPKEPDSVLVLHRDRIDEDGRLQVTRFAGPDGRVLWTAALPLSILQAVMPGKDSLLLFGRAYAANRPRAGDPYHSAHEWVIALDLKDGAIRTFDVSAQR